MEVVSQGGTERRQDARECKSESVSRHAQACSQVVRRQHVAVVYTHMLSTCGCRGTHAMHMCMCMCMLSRPNPHMFVCANLRALLLHLLLLLRRLIGGRLIGGTAGLGPPAVCMCMCMLSRPNRHLFVCVRTCALCSCALCSSVVFFFSVFFFFSDA